MNFTVILSITLIFILGAYVFSFIYVFPRTDLSRFFVFKEVASRYAKYSASFLKDTNVLERNRENVFEAYIVGEVVSFYLIPASAAISIRSTPPRIETPVIRVSSKLLNWRDGVTQLYTLRKNKCQGLLTGNIFLARIHKKTS